MTNRSIIKRELIHKNKNNDLNIDRTNKLNGNDREFKSPLGKILLPSTIGIPSQHASHERGIRDPRIIWAPAISISGRTDQPLITPQYKKKEELIAAKSEQVRMNPKIATNLDLTYLTRMGNERTKLQISFLPHKINLPRKLLTNMVKRPGPTSYQQYKNYTQLGEKYIFAQQPHVIIRPLINLKVKRNEMQTGKNEKRSDFEHSKPFWNTIGARTYDSRLPNAPMLTIHNRFYMKSNKEGKENVVGNQGSPGPAMYPFINNKNQMIAHVHCGIRGITISPRYREKRLQLYGPGPALIEQNSLDRGYKKILKTSPAFTISSRWSPYSYTYADKCSENFS